MTGWQLQLAAMLGKQQNIGRYIVLQQQYSLLCREVEWEVRGGMPDTVQIFPFRSPQLLRERALHCMEPAERRMAFWQDETRRGQSSCWFTDPCSD